MGWPSVPAGLVEVVERNLHHVCFVEGRRDWGKVDRPCGSGYSPAARRDCVVAARLDFITSRKPRRLFAPFRRRAV